MAKQMYANSKYSPVAWNPLKTWLFGQGPDVAGIRLLRLNGFNKQDDDLHKVVAKCNFRLARMANLPWGRAAAQPTGYSNVVYTEQVFMSEYSVGCWYIFFLNPVCHVHI